MKEMMRDLAAIAMNAPHKKSDFDTVGQQAQLALEQIFEYMEQEPPWTPDQSVTYDSLDFILDSAGVLRREVELKGKWWEDAFGAMLVKTQTGEYAALIPRNTAGYRFYSPKNKKWMVLTKEAAQTYTKKALVFYRMFPAGKVTGKKLIKFYKKDITIPRITLFLLFAFLASAMAFVYPEINEMVIESVLPLMNAPILLPIAVVAVATVLLTWLFQILYRLISLQVETIAGTSFVSALMGRLIYLPASFFSKWSAGELGNRLLGASKAIPMMISAALHSVIGLITFGFGLSRIGHYVPQLVPVVYIFVLVMGVFLFWSGYAQQKYSNKVMRKRSKLSSLVYRLLSGITKIKTSGSEKRAFFQWGSQYAELAEITFNPSPLLLVQGEITLSLSILATIVIYLTASQSNIAVAKYMAFFAVWGLVLSALITLSANVMVLFQARSILGLVTPVLEAIPEMQGHKVGVEPIKNNIDITGLSFRYDEESPWVLQNLDFHVQSGEYVAIVGKSGCGKSTLIRLLLGFEYPAIGTVSYNKQDIKSIDLHALRQHIGCVLQDGALFQGTILQNILICAPDGDADIAWEAARKAGIATDIEQMPMKMHTIVSEQSQNISGGQKQRILIARAIAAKPSILIFDEATSALDNISQKAVTTAIEEMDCTRIVVAHRLSTIRSCKRIVVLDSGTIAEDGSYDELLKNNGIFSELVKRQMES